jgi:hypothetical protein
MVNSAAGGSSRGKPRSVSCLERAGGPRTIRASYELGVLDRLDWSSCHCCSATASRFPAGLLPDLLCYYCEPGGPSPTAQPDSSTSHMTPAAFGHSPDPEPGLSGPQPFCAAHKRFFYRLHVHRRRKGSRPSLSEADYAALIAAAHRALNAPVIGEHDQLPFGQQFLGIEAAEIVCGLRSSPTSARPSRSMAARCPMLKTISTGTAVIGTRRGSTAAARRHRLAS